jgi:hypothetical protein
MASGCGALFKGTSCYRAAAWNVVLQLADRDSQHTGREYAEQRPYITPIAPRGSATLCKTCRCVGGARNGQAPCSSVFPRCPLSEPICFSLEVTQASPNLP